MEKYEDGLSVSAGGGSKIAPIEPGTYPAVCYGLVDIGYQYSAAFDNASRKVVIMWEIPDETITTEDGEKSRVISETYTASIGEKANLRKMLEAWRGKAFTDDELKCFNLRNIIGAGCMLSIIHQESKKGGMFAKVTAVMKLPKGMPAPEGTIEHVLFDLMAPGAHAEIDALPEWLQKRIKESETFKEMATSFVEPDEELDEPMPWEK